MGASSQKIAVIGGGIAGLSASFSLSKKYDVTLYEANSWLGGHAHSKSLTDEFGESFDVDTAFLIFNDKTYPTFLNFVEQLGVLHRVIPAEMSSCFWDTQSSLHYTLGAGLGPFIARPQTLLKLGFYKIAVDFFRFRKRAKNDLNMGTDLSQLTVEQYLSDFSSEFLELFVLPLTAAIWSLPVRSVKEYPIDSILKYFDNHQLLDGSSERRWRTFHGSSRVYTEAFRSQFRGKIRLNCLIKKINRKRNSVELLTAEGVENFDSVVVATHADLGLKLINNPTSAERELLGAWTYQANPVTLHSDTRLLHPNPRLWGTWNMRRISKEKYEVSYYLNRLQKLKTKKPLILSLTDGSSIDPRKVISTYEYRHPVFNHKSISTQKSLSQLNGRDRIYFCGSYFGYGFHEDAARSAKDVTREHENRWETSCA